MRLWIVIISITLSVQLLAQGSAPTAELKALQQGLTQRERDWLQLTTRWRVRIEVLPKPQEVIEAELKAIEQDVKRRFQRGELNQQQMEQVLQHARKGMFTQRKKEVGESILKVEGQGDYWIASGQICTVGNAENKALVIKEVLLPGSYVISSLKQPIETQHASKAPDWLDSTRVQFVMPEARTFLMPRNPILTRVLLLGENPLHWMPSEFVSVQKQGAAYILHSRYWYHNPERVKEQWPVGREVPNDPTQQLIANMGLKVTFYVDSTRQFAITRFEGIQGDEVVEVNRWYRFGSLWLPAKIVIQEFETDVVGGEEVIRDGIRYWQGGRIARRLATRTTIELLSVDWTRRSIAFKDMLPADQSLVDYRLGVDTHRTVIYRYSGRFPSLKELSELYQQQQQQRQLASTQAGNGWATKWVWLVPALLITVGLLWFLRTQRHFIRRNDLR
jgi:hypothetical protein